MQRGMVVPSREREEAADLVVQRQRAFDKAKRDIEALCKDMGVDVTHPTVELALRQAAIDVRQGIATRFGLTKLRNDLERASARRAQTGPVGEVVRVAGGEDNVTCGRGHGGRTRVRLLGEDDTDRCPICVERGLRGGTVAALVGFDRLDMSALREAAELARDRVAVAARALGLLHGSA